MVTLGSTTDFSVIKENGYIFSGCGGAGITKTFKIVCLPSEKADYSKGKKPVFLEHFFLFRVGLFSEGICVKDSTPKSESLFHCFPWFPWECPENVSVVSSPLKQIPFCTYLTHLCRVESRLVFGLVYYIYKGSGYFIIIMFFYRNCHMSLLWDTRHKCINLEMFNV